METAIALLVLVLIAGLIVTLLRRMKTTRRVTVLEDIALGGDARTVEPALATALSSIKGADYMGVAGLHAVVHPCMGNHSGVPAVPDRPRLPLRS